jgi:hypothetical protein
LKNLRLRVLQCSGERLTWDRPLTGEEIVEIGLNENAKVMRLRKEHEKAMRQHAQRTSDQVSKRKAVANELALFHSAAANLTAPPPPVISLRKLYTGLPPHARRLTNANGADISRLARGDLLIVPVSQSGGICEPRQPPYRQLWYRVAALKANRQVELKLAEFKQIKQPSEQDLKDGRQIKPEQEWLAGAFLQQPGNDEVIARLLQGTRADDQPSHPAH